MKSDNFTSFERNKYFFGKLLTASDFEAEQLYFTGKRKLINRLLFGTGVVCGMNVVKVDDETIVIDSGMALDCKGREIVMPQSMVCKLKALEGIKTLDDIISDTAQNTNTLDVYLCARYSEEPVEPVHSIARSVLDDENDGAQHNKVKETCTLYLTAREPDVHPNNSYYAAFMYLLLFNKHGVRVSVSAPKYVTSNETVFLETLIEKGAVNSLVEVSYKMRLSFLASDGKREITIVHKEHKDDKVKKSIIKTPLTAIYSYHGENVAEITITDLKVKIGTMQRNIESDFVGNIHIVDDCKSALLEEEREKTLESILKHQSDIYLARLHLIATQGYCAVDSITHMPFEQYVITGERSESLNMLSPLKSNTIVTSPTTVPINDTDNTGSIVITVPENNGTFRIDVTLKQPIPSGEYHLEWLKMKKIDMVSFSLHPDVCHLEPNSAIQFEVVTMSKAIRAESLIWTVEPSDGGRIEKNGEFFASDKVGFYKIKAQTPNGSISATAFVVI